MHDKTEVTEQEKELRAKIGSAVLADLTDRRGIRQAFDDIDPDVLEEIGQSIGRIALNESRQELRIAALTEARMRVIGCIQKPRLDAVGMQNIMFSRGLEYAANVIGNMITGKPLSVREADALPQQELWNPRD